MYLMRKPSDIFYGWWIVAASFFVAMVVGVIFYGFTAIFEPIADEFGWSYTHISLAFSLRGLELSLFAPFAGIFVDRWGPRRLIFSGVVINTVGLILLSNTTSIGMFYGAFALIAIGTSACTQTVLMTTVANWFRVKIGIASGIAMCGFGFSGLLVPVVVKLIEMYEWRMTIIILALGILVVALPLSLLFRHKPEQYGLFPDDQVQEPPTHNDSLPQAPEAEVKTKQALKSSIFWRLTLAFMYHMMVVSATITHVMPYLSSIGIARSMSGLVASSIPLMSIGGRLGFGWLADKFDKRLVAAAGFIMVGFGMLCLGFVSVGIIWWLVPFLVFFGIGYGGVNALRVSLVRECFGRTRFGTIFGLIMSLGALGSIIGPTVAGWAYDKWGTYQAVWFVFAGLAATAVTYMLTIRQGRLL